MAQTAPRRFVKAVAGPATLAAAGAAGLAPAAAHAAWPKEAFAAAAGETCYCPPDPGRCSRIPPQPQRNPAKDIQARAANSPASRSQPMHISARARAITAPRRK